jgi:peptidyl-prolyl cis-trans isomerase A (cyclophilin A)
MPNHQKRKNKQNPMKTKLLFAFLNLMFLSSFAQKNIPCLIKTSMGDIKVELYADKAPVTVANFLRYVDHQ